MSMSKKGFTLTELLVVVVILGIIAGLSIPLIRNLSATFEKKKYESYSNSVLAAGKLYTDAYSEDLFGHNEYGCAYITYDKLVERRLLKDIEIDGVSCNSNNTYIRVIKQKEKYGYKTYLECGKKKSGKIEEATISIPKNIPAMDTTACTGVEDSNLAVRIDNTQAKGNYDKNRKKTRVIISSGTGIDSNITIYAKWSKDPNDRENTGFEKVDFKVKTNQEKELLEGNIITTQSSEILTPKGDGIYYLIVRVDHLQDLYGHNWKNKSDPTSKYVVSDPFNIDNTPPTIKTEVYKCDSAGIKTGSVLLTKEVTQGTEEVIDLSSITGNRNGWLASKEYGNGVCFEFIISDNHSLKSSKLEQNTEMQKANTQGYKEFNDNKVWKSDTYDASLNNITVSKKIIENGHRYLKFTVKDYAGNKTAINIDVKIDTTGPSKPTINNPYENKWINKNVALTLSSSDALNGMGEYYYTYNAGANSYSIDKNDDRAKWVKLTGGTNKLSFTTEPWTENIDLKTYIQACDELENCSNKNETIIKIDKTKPNTPTITNPNHNTWVQESYGIDVSSHDTAVGIDTCSGINEYYYTYNSTATQIGTNPSSQLVKLTGGKNKETFHTESWTTTMNKTVYVVVYDNAGNKSDPDSTIIKIDKTPPEIPTIDSYTDKWRRELQMTVNGYDEHSGIKSYQYTYNADAPADQVYTEYTSANDYWRIEDGAEISEPTYKATFTAERDQNVYWRVCDNVGNCSDRTEGNPVKIDRTPPTCGDPNKTTTQSTSGVSGTVGCTDKGTYKSGCKSGTGSFSGYKTNSGQTSTVKYVTIEDNAGNKNTDCPVTIYRGACTKQECTTYFAPFCTGVPGALMGNVTNYNYSEPDCKSKCGYPNGTRGIHYEWKMNTNVYQTDSEHVHITTGCSMAESNSGNIGNCQWKKTNYVVDVINQPGSFGTSAFINTMSIRGCCGCCYSGKIECTQWKYY